MIVSAGSVFSLNSINHLIVAMVTGCVLFDVHTEFFKYSLDEFRLQRVEMTKHNI
jgi:hypothetical protein